ncbi:hypothetical protein Bbelb_329190 [Branchiostoma belcheri]|nr:hypothetical protein Bbelb_329190 [Branchiostoma belcheri]
MARWFHTAGLCAQANVTGGRGQGGVGGGRDLAVARSSRFEYFLQRRIIGDPRHVRPDPNPFARRPARARTDTHCGDNAAYLHLAAFTAALRRGSESRTLPLRHTTPLKGRFMPPQEENTGQTDL